MQKSTLTWRCNIYLGFIGINSISARRRIQKVVLQTMAENKTCVHNHGVDAGKGEHLDEVQRRPIIALSDRDGLSSQYSWPEVCRWELPSLGSRSQARVLLSGWPCHITASARHDASYSSWRPYNTRHLGCLVCVRAYQLRCGECSYMR